MESNQTKSTTNLRRASFYCNAHWRTETPPPPFIKLFHRNVKSNSAHRNGYNRPKRQTLLLQLQLQCTWILLYKYLEPLECCTFSTRHDIGIVRGLCGCTSTLSTSPDGAFFNLPTGRVTSYGVFLFWGEALDSSTIHDKSFLSWGKAHTWAPLR